jgi:replication fork protection complex subunit Tof1/Swi1
MFKNGHLRLLMTLVGFQRVGDSDDPNAAWTIPSTLTPDQLKQAFDLIKKFEFSPPTFDDGKEAADLIRRKSAGTASRRRAAFDDEDDGIDDDDEEEPLFPAGGPTPMNRADVLKQLKKTRRRRRQDETEDAEDDGPTDEQLKARADARRARELEKNRKIKSELFVHDSDDESDEERDRIFFEAEEKLRQKQKITVMKGLLGVPDKQGKSTATSTKKRQSSAMSADSDDNDDVVVTNSRKRQSSAILVDSDDDATGPSGRSSSAAPENVLVESEGDATDTPMSSPHAKSSQTKRRKVSIGDEPADVAMSDDDDEDLPVAKPVRPRVRAGFIVDSSDEE